MRALEQQKETSWIREVASGINERGMSTNGAVLRLNAFWNETEVILDAS